MDKKILDNLKIGEKAVDIQEHFYGRNGKNVSYRVTFFSCVSTIFGFRRIKKYTMPFYFNTKDLATKYIEEHEKFIFDCDETGFFLYPSKNADKDIFRKYYLIRKDSISNMVLSENKIWDGTVNYDNSEYRWTTFNIPFTKIFEVDEIASKENSDGKTFSYILTKV